MEECTRCEREYDVDAISKIDWYDIDWCENCNKEENPHPLCSNCGEVEVESYNQPCSIECRNEYIADWLTE